MAKIQPCNRGCKKLITVQFDEEIGKYVPFEVDTSGNPTNKHNCPNSDYNKNKQGQQQQTTSNNTFQQQPQQQQQQQQAPIDRPTLESVMLNQNSQKIDELKKQVNDLKYFTEQQIYTLLKENVDISKNTNMMCDAVVAHLELTKPKSASELYSASATEQQTVQNEVNQE